MDKLKILEFELWRYLSAIGFDPSGRPIEIRKQVGSIGSNKIEIYPNEHPPAHFHVMGPDLDVCFIIPGCEIMPGFKVPKASLLKNIKQFYKNNENLLIEVWNQLRPAHCQVGKLEGSLKQSL